MLLSPVRRSDRDPWTITVPNPTAAENIQMRFTSRAVTAVRARAYIRGSSTPSITWVLEFRSTRDGSGTTIATATTTNTSTGSDPSITTAAIPADSLIILRTTAQSGTVSALSVTLEVID